MRREDMIDFTRAFDTAWERMNVILFRPFDFGKWCVIGFSAFLADLLAGGNGFNMSSSYNNSFNNKWQANYNFSTHTATSSPSLSTSLTSLFSGMQVGLIVFISLVIVGLVFVFILVLYWLGARGQFLLLDNIVRNRGAISEPWRRYALLSNNLFLFLLLFVAISLALFVPIFLSALLVCWPLFQHHRWPSGGETSLLIVLGMLYLLVALPVGIVFFLFREWGVPLMFRNGLKARAAFMETLNLIRLHPGTAAIFVLLRLVLWMAVAIVSVIACCATCCIGMLPYLGTVILLPAIIYVRCFTLDCLAQLGPPYDVWTVDVPPEAERSTSLPISPPPPLG